MSASLAAQALRCAYRGHVALDGVSIEFAPGEFVGLVGANGSGKTTLLRSLARVLPPLSGQALLGGRDLYQLPPTEVARRVGYAPQEEAPVFDFTVEQVVLMGRTPHLKGGRERAEDFAAVDEALTLTGLTEFRNRSVGALSGGERQRVTIARALAQAGDFLLLDEPLAHLDIGRQSSLLRLLKRLVAERGVGVVCAIHDLNLASEYSDRLALLSNGRLMAVGTPDEVLRAETLQMAYDTPIMVRPNPLSGRPAVFALPTAPGADAGEDAPRVHLVCGGGTGLGLLPMLLEAGCRVSVGVTNLLDTDEEAARALGLAQATETPFSPIGPAALEKARALVEQAEAVVVANMPFGAGNLANLGLALDAARAGKTVLLLGASDFADRDFSGGQATRQWNELKALGAVVVETPEALEPYLRDAKKSATRSSS